ncbi:MAG: ATP-dependent helicase [Woeseiaceae bacterium]|nr:ATP-dependent helicase [Woeseiaceae bacterium]
MSVAEPYLDKLNEAQRKAAVFGAETRDPLLVIAGAGTGKTMTLAHRVAYLINQGADPERILLLTFTRRAAEEMTRRVEAIVRESRPGERCELPWAGTFHSVANRLLRRFASNLGLDPGFSVLDQGDAGDLMDVVRHELELSSTSRRFPGKAACLAIYSRCMNTMRPLEVVVRDSFPWCTDWQQELATLFRAYVERKQASQSLDYDDLLTYWSHLVADDGFAAEIGNWFDFVLVDEYQDTNVVQANIIRAMKPGGQGVTVVGDDAQSIYSFRAATVDNILEFPDQCSPRAEVVTLEQNYRSCQPILDSANLLIADGERQFGKTLFSKKPGSARPRYVTVEDADAEAECVVDGVLQNREAGLLLMDQAVLFRNSHHSDRLEVELVRRNIPYVKYGGLKFLEAAHVKDVISILKWADNPKNEVAAFRVLKLMQGMGPRYAARCYAHLQSSGFDLKALQEFTPPPACRDEWLPLCSLMEQLADSNTDAAWQAQFSPLVNWYRPQLERLYESAETRLADVEQLEQISSRYATRERFLTELTLDPPSSSGDQSGAPLIDEDYLILSTVHSAKGQEWEAVFVLNVTDGNFPSEFATGDPAAIDEERRLLYVAMTRAKQSLSLLSPLKFFVTQQHRHGDRHVYGARSRFMTDRLMESFDECYFGNAEQPRSLKPTTDRRIDVQTAMKQMW